MKVNVLATLLWGLAAKFAFAQPSADVYRADNTSSGVLEVVQAQVPPRTSYAKPACKQVVFNHNFANSYGVPYVGTYSPPASCNYTTTIFNMSVTSAGRQYDRLALLFLDDIEVWRTSTAMPNPTGIHWSYQKDMSIFDSLLRSEKKVIFDLSNVYSDLYTGAFNVTLEALYFGDVYDHLEPADLIYPISALASSRNISSVMSLPDDNGTVSITLPRNVKTAVVSLLASGNGAEEFWYTNVPSEYVETFPSNPSWLYGYSPFREVELLIDGQLAGVTWPFPILFTGGVSPGMWRPVVGIDTYDLPSFEIDVTPWLPLLCDGSAHSFSLKVVGFDSAVPGNIGPIGENWWVTGSVFVWIDEAGNQTTGSTVQSLLPAPSFSYHPAVAMISAQNGSTTNSSFYFTLSAHRSLSISSTIQTSAGTRSVSWSQTLDFTNIQNMTSEAFNQSLAMTSTGSYNSSFAPGETTYSYPLNLFSAYIIAPTAASLSSVRTLIDRSLFTDGFNTLPYLSGISGGVERLETRQNASSAYSWNETIVEGRPGDASQNMHWLAFDGSPGAREGGVHQFSRFVAELDDRLVEDQTQWAFIHVPETVALPFVDGEPSV